MKNRWKKGKNPFTLPMSITLGTFERRTRWIAHSLEFDLVTSGTTEREALDNLRLQVKSYVEFGLSNGWDADIIFPAPDVFWEKYNSGVVTLEKPIVIDSANRMKVYSVRNMPVAA